MKKERSMESVRVKDEREGEKDMKKESRRAF